MPTAGPDPWPSAPRPSANIKMPTAGPEILYFASCILHFIPTYPCTRVPAALRAAISIAPPRGAHLGGRKADPRRAPCTRFRVTVSRRAARGCFNRAVRGATSEGGFTPDPAKRPLCLRPSQKHGRLPSLGTPGTLPVFSGLRFAFFRHRRRRILGPAHPPGEARQSARLTVSATRDQPRRCPASPRSGFPNRSGRRTRTASGCRLRRNTRRSSTADCQSASDPPR